jgi:hypothetical protein
MQWAGKSKGCKQLHPAGCQVLPEPVYPQAICADAANAAKEICEIRD